MMMFVIYFFITLVNRTNKPKDLKNEQVNFRSINTRKLTDHFH